MELWSSSVLDFEPQVEQLFTPAESLMVKNFFGHEVFMPTTSIRPCTPAEEATCGGCFCLFRSNAVSCLCF
jgi:hypothetical protein